MSDFVVVDVETANADLESICQIGIASFEGGIGVAKWVELVNPEDFFDPWNVEIHGIKQHDVRGARTFDQMIDEVRGMLSDRVVVSHTPFDRIALERASDKYGVDCPVCTWLDSARVVRRAWPERYARSGYGLANVAADLGIAYIAHNALEDARAAGEVLLHAMSETGLSLDDWLVRVRQPISPSARAHFNGAEYDPNPEGPLYGEVICFTGALTMPRKDAAAHAAVAGCTVGNNVTKHTTLLVVGDNDIRKLAGHDLSSKHRKAIGLVASGQPIRLLSEADFLRVVLPCSKEA